MKTGFPFASASVKARENGLLKKVQLEKMIQAQTAQDAYATLLETGYGADAQAESAIDFEQTILAELKKAHAFVHSIFPNPEIEELFYLQYDYHNLKMLAKAFVLEQTIADSSLSAFGNISTDVIRNAVLERKFTSLTQHMDRAMKELDQRFAVKEDISLIDITLDVAYANEICERLKKIRDISVRQYFEVYFDFTNLIIMLRLKRMSFPQEWLKKALLPGGLIPERLFMQAFTLDDDAQKQLLTTGKYAEAFRKGYEGLEQTNELEWMEKERAGMLNQILSEGAGDMFSLGPVLHYMNAKENEANCIRVILAGKLNKIPVDTISRLCFEVM